MIKIKNDEELVQSVRKKRTRVYPPFKMVCFGKYSIKHKRITLDPHKILMDMNPKSKERKAIEYIMDNVDICNVAEIDLMSSEKKDFFYDGIKVLFDKDIVRKVKTDVYMLNPFFMVPVEMTDVVVHDWDRLQISKIITGGTTTKKIGKKIEIPQDYIDDNKPFENGDDPFK